jgi:RNA polymerase sigma-70 factor (ECF subfamily)
MRASDHQFRQFVEQHQAMVFSIALRLLGERGVAEEVAQDCFVELYRSLDRIESPEHLCFWLRRVAVHRATDGLRRRALRPESQGEEWMELHGDGRNARAGNGKLDSRIESVLMSLPEGLRVAIVLRYQEEMRPEEIAALLGQPLATTKSNLQRGLELLRRKSSVLLKVFVL